MIPPFVDSGQVLEDFADTMYVRCPRCHRCATVSRISCDEMRSISDASLCSKIERPELSSNSFGRSFHPRKLSCLPCSYTQIWRGNVLRKGSDDWYFGYPLWLQTPCCDKILWALNEEHVSFLEQYVTAKQRTKFYAEGCIRNGTMASRLPNWIKSAKNRREVLKGLARLRSLLD